MSTINKTERQTEQLKTPNEITACLQTSYVTKAAGFQVFL